MRNKLGARGFEGAGDSGAARHVPPSERREAATLLGPSPYGNAAANEVRSQLHRVAALQL
jgi:hypothetical protein